LGGGEKKHKEEIPEEVQKKSPCVLESYHPSLPVGLQPSPLILALREEGAPESSHWGGTLKKAFTVYQLGSVKKPQGGA